MSTYKFLEKQFFEANNYKIIPIRYEDRINIMNWRNEQMYHLRQHTPLTLKDQNNYFSNIISQIFKDSKPSQILFSYLENDICIGYGGLVHINWIDKNAEISFIMDTSLEEKKFKFHWSIFLSLLEKVAFRELNFYKIFTYAFDIRPNLYEVLESSLYKKEATLKEHCLFNNKYIDVVIHSKINKEYLYFRKAIFDDVKVYFEWLNDSDVRSQSYNSNIIDFESHSRWFESKIKDETAFLLIFQNTDKENIGQVRIQKNENNEALIGISIDEKYRGKSYASKAIKIASKYFLDLNPNFVINAFIKIENKGSEKAFKNAGFKLKNIVEYEKHQSFHYINKKNEERLF
jgi:RimJ/RimL family protein N-acetyltransferase